MPSGMLSLMYAAAAAAALVALADENTAHTPDRYAPLVVSPTGIEPSSELPAHVLHNEFLCIMHGQLLTQYICEPSYYNISEQTTLVYCMFDYTNFAMFTPKSKFNNFSTQRRLKSHRSQHQPDTPVRVPSVSTELPQPECSPLSDRQRATVSGSSFRPR